MNYLKIFGIYLISNIKVSVENSTLTITKVIIPSVKLRARFDIYQTNTNTESK